MTEVTFRGRIQNALTEGVPIAIVRQQEESQDVQLSTLFAWGKALNIPIEELIAGGSMRWVVSTLSEAEAPEAEAAIWEHLCSPDRFQEVLRAEPIDAEVLDAMLGRLGEQAIDHAEVVAGLDKQARGLFECRHGLPGAHIIN